MRIVKVGGKSKLRVYFGVVFDWRTTPLGSGGLSCLLYVVRANNHVPSRLHLIKRIEQKWYIKTEF